MSETLPLVYFTHADLKSKENLKISMEIVKSEKSSTKSSFDEKKSRKKIKLNIQDDNMNYEALEEDEQPFLIGILDKTSDVISVCNTPYFIMKPGCYLNTSNQNESTDSSITTYSQKLDNLTAAFGSSKKRKAMQTKIKNRIDTATLDVAVSAAVEETLKNFDRQEPVDMLTETKNLEQFSIMPVPSQTAKAPNEVYNLNEVLCISQAEFERFTVQLSTKFATATNQDIKKWKEAGVYSEFICERLLILLSTKSGMQYKLIKCRQLAYMYFLLTLFRLKPVQLGSKMPFASSEVPAQIVNKLFDLYTVLSVKNAQSKNVRTIPSRLKDKLICHILILALYIDDFSTNLETFQKDLKISIQRIVDFYNALGCHVKSKVTTVGGKKVVSKVSSLTLPLNDMKNLEGKRRAKKV